MPRITPRASTLFAVLATIALVAGCSSGSPATVRSPHARNNPSTSGSAPVPGSAASSSPSPTSRAATSSPSSATYVNVRTLNSDGATYGVGMPVIAYFQRKPVSGTAWQAATKVTANGTPVVAAWYFEASAANPGYPYEAHLRAEHFWPAHSRIHVTFPPRGTSLGGDLVADGALSSLDFSTGAANIATVDNRTHTITVVSDGRTMYRMPVSLGAAGVSETLRGTKVIMEKGLDISMRGPGYYDPHVKYTQRLTYGGEYLHAAPWNCTTGPGCVGPANNIGHANSSNGCTNLTPSDARTLYDFLGVGDVVTYPNADGRPMTLGAGYGDWNLTWTQWLTGGAVPTS